LLPPLPDRSGPLSLRLYGADDGQVIAGFPLLFPAGRSADFKPDTPDR
jgi:hypothetical protein